MNLKLDSNKLTAILRKVNILLAVLAAASAVFCGVMAFGLLSNPSLERMGLRQQEMEAQIPQLQQKIEDQQALVAQAEKDAQAQVAAANEEQAAVQQELDAATERKAGMDNTIYTFQNSEQVYQQMRQNIADIRVEYGTAIRKLEDKILAGESNYRICYLTFDDGPSYYTGDFLDKIDELDIYVTFFTIGYQMGKNQDAQRDAYLRREALSGHSICNHTYTHAIHNGLYYSKENFMDAVKKQEDVVYSATGIRTDIVRFPAGSYYCPQRTAVIEELTNQGYGWIDWSANAFDSGTNIKTKEFVARTVVWQVSQEQISVVLMHDWRLETLGALDSIVSQLKEKGYIFLPLFKESSTVGTVRPKWDN